MMTQVPNQLIEKSHDYNFLNFCKYTNSFSFAEDKLRRMWLCHGIESFSQSLLFSHCIALHGEGCSRPATRLISSSGPRAGKSSAGATASPCATTSIKVPSNSSCSTRTRYARPASAASSRSTVWKCSFDKLLDCS